MTILTPAVKKITKKKSEKLFLLVMQMSINIHFINCDICLEGPQPRKGCFGGRDWGGIIIDILIV